MHQYGLIGYPLSHSFSKGYFRDKFLEEDIRDCHYENFPLESISEFPDLVASDKDIRGLNVTIPYKEEVIPYLDDLDEEAAAIGAVNTICFIGDKLVGHNTDVYGFAKSLEPLLPVEPLKALILGTGGASKAVAYVLDELNIPYQYVSRREDKHDVLSYNSINKELVREHRLIINTTPLGMFPNIESLPDIPYDGVGDEHILYDLVYNPEVSRFLEEGLNRGATVKNGLEMLKLQAEKSWAIWNDY